MNRSIRGHSLSFFFSSLFRWFSLFCRPFRSDRPAFLAPSFISVPFRISDRWNRFPPSGSGDKESSGIERAHAKLAKKPISEMNMAAAKFTEQSAGCWMRLVCPFVYTPSSVLIYMHVHHRARTRAKTDRAHSRALLFRSAKNSSSHSRACGSDQISNKAYGDPRDNTGNGNWKCPMKEAGKIKDWKMKNIALCLSVFTSFFITEIFSIELIIWIIRTSFSDNYCPVQIFIFLFFD